jgi:hypothetical protein
MTTAPTEITGKGSMQKAQHMARYGHRDWLCWHDDQGEYADRRTPANIKKMLLATGTKGTWVLIHGSSGCPMHGFWAMGINMINQSKRGY